MSSRTSSGTKDDRTEDTSLKLSRSSPAFSLKNVEAAYGEVALVIAIFSFLKQVGEKSDKILSPLYLPLIYVVLHD